MKKKKLYLPLLCLLCLSLFFLASKLDEPSEHPQEIVPAVSSPSGQTVVSGDSTDTVSALAPTVTPEPIPHELLITDADKIVLSEVMFKNHATVIDCDGDFSDWIELYNCSDEVVDLNGWSISNRASGASWEIPRILLQPGEYLLLAASGKDYSDNRFHADFTLSTKDTVYLFNAYGYLADSLTCCSDDADVSIVPVGDGSCVSDFPTPGFSNDRNGFEQYQQMLYARGPLQINEVWTANTKYEYENTLGYTDLVEILNISGSDVLLSDYYLSDDSSNFLRWRFPSITLASGQAIIVHCAGNEPAANCIQADFKLDSAGEVLYLAHADGTICDYVRIPDLPVNCSYGRAPEAPGWFYYQNSTPSRANVTDHWRFQSLPAVFSAEPGIYDDVSQVTVELLSSGTVYYTTDGTVPTVHSSVYTRPFYLSETSTLRTLTVEEGCLPSDVVTGVYIINEHHTLPVLSLTFNLLGEFRKIWNDNLKDTPILCNATLFENGSGFSVDCAAEMKGWTSLDNPKKSLGIRMKGIYGSRDLDYDLFGNGITHYDELAIRAGQDYPLSIIKNEVCQTLCQEMSDSVPTQNSKYCCLYINGMYYGIYCLKDDITASNYAITENVRKSSVTLLRSPVASTDSFYNNDLAPLLALDLSLPENYARVCEVFDINALIDWFIMEGYCANTDVNGNLKYVRSSETDNLWRPVYYDLDWSFTDRSRCFTNVIYSNLQITPLFEHLKTNAEFVHAVLTRYAEVSQTVLSDEHVLSVIDSYADLIEPEVNRERDRWGGLYQSWQNRVDQLREYVDGYSAVSVQALCRILQVSYEDRVSYFGF